MAKSRRDPSSPPAQGALLAVATTTFASVAVTANPLVHSERFPRSTQGRKQLCWFVSVLPPALPPASPCLGELAAVSQCWPRVPSCGDGGSGTPAQRGAAGNSRPPAFLYTNGRKSNVLFSSPHTPLRSTRLLAALPVAAPSVSFAIDGTSMQSGSFCPPSFEDSIYYEFISLQGLCLGSDKEICNHRTHLN